MASTKSANLSQSPVEVERFICVDVDRTVLKTTTLFTDYIVPALRAIAEEDKTDNIERQNHHQIIDTLVRDMAENVGRSFDFLAVYNERTRGDIKLSTEALASSVVNSMCQDGKISEQAINGMLANKTIDVLIAIDNLPDSRWGFVTSGGEQTQTVKLLILEQILAQTAKLPLRAQIISTEHKTRDIDTVWRQANGLFAIPEELTGKPEVFARSVIMIDDKPKNLVTEDTTNISTVLVEQLDMPDDGRERLPLSAVVERLNNIDI